MWEVKSGRIRCSRLSLATQKVWGQPAFREREERVTHIHLFGIFEDTDDNLCNKDTNFPSTSGPVLQSKQDLILYLQAALYHLQMEFGSVNTYASNITVRFRVSQMFFWGAGRKRTILSSSLLLRRVMANLVHIKRVGWHWSQVIAC